MKKNSLIILSAFFIFFSYSAAQTRDISKIGPVTEKVDLLKYNKVFYISQKTVRKTQRKNRIHENM